MSLLLLLLSAGCERNVSVELPREPARLVVNAFFTPDSLLQMQVSRSQSVLERPRITGVEGAEVKLYEDGQEIATLRPDSLLKFRFSSRQKLIQAGRNYGISVSSPNLGTVTAESFVPVPVRIRQATITESAGVDLNGSTYNILRLELDDPAGEENYYAVQVRSMDFQLVKNNQTGKTDTVWRESRRNLFREPTVSGVRAGRQLLFSDRQFDGKTTSLLVYFYPIPPNRAERSQYSVLLFSAGKLYYEYHRRLADHLGNQTFDIIGGEPVPMPGNITNGYGIFAGYSFDRVVL